MIIFFKIHPFSTCGWMLGLDAQKNNLSEMVLLSTHYMYFGIEIHARKIFSKVLPRGLIVSLLQ